jgi:hypothetical protein
MLFLLSIILHSHFSFGGEGCTEVNESLEIVRPHVFKFSERTNSIAHEVQRISCPSTITRDDYDSCTDLKRNFAGIFMVECNKKEFANCCYQKSSGSTWADYKLVPCALLKK